MSSISIITYPDLIQALHIPDVRMYLEQDDVAAKGLMDRIEDVSAYLQPGLVKPSDYNKVVHVDHPGIKTLHVWNHYLLDADGSNSFDLTRKSNAKSIPDTPVRYRLEHPNELPAAKPSRFHRSYRPLWLRLRDAGLADGLDGFAAPTPADRQRREGFKSEIADLERPPADPRHEPYEGSVRRAIAALLKKDRAPHFAVLVKHVVAATKDTDYAVVRQLPDLVATGSDAAEAAVGRLAAAIWLAYEPRGTWCHFVERQRDTKIITSMMSRGAGGAAYVGPRGFPLTDATMLTSMLEWEVYTIRDRMPAGAPTSTATRASILYDYGEEARLKATATKKGATKEEATTTASKTPKAVAARKPKSNRIADAKLPRHLKNALQRHRVTKIDQASQMADEDLRCLSGIGACELDLLRTVAPRIDGDALVSYPADRLLATLPLNRDTVWMLELGGYHTGRDAIAATDAELLALPNFNDRHLSGLRSIVARPDSKTGSTPPSAGDAIESPDDEETGALVAACSSLKQILHHATTPLVF